MKRVTVGGLLLLCAAVGAIWYFAGPASACSEQDEAMAELLRVMKTPENLIASRRSGLRKGPKDIQSDPWKEEDRKLSAQQIADGAELASGIIYGDASRVQKVLERYDGRPYALCQTASYVAYSFYQVGIPFTINIHPHGGVLFVERSKREQIYGNLSVTFVMGQTPKVKVSVRPEGSNEGVWQDDDTDAVTVDVLMGAIGRECTRAVLFRKNIKGDEPR